METQKALSTDEARITIKAAPRRIPDMTAPHYYAYTSSQECAHAMHAGVHKPLGAAAHLQAILVLLGGGSVITCDDTHPELSIDREDILRD